MSESIREAFGALVFISVIVAWAAIEITRLRTIREIARHAAQQETSAALEERTQ